MFKNAIFFILAVIFVISCSAKPNVSPTISNQTNNYAEKNVKASYYGKDDGFQGKQTASGEKFNNQGLTAAHKSLPFGTKLKVTNPQNNKTIEVIINDRGPFRKGKDLDLSYAAAKELGITEKGSANLKIEVVK